MGDDPLVSVIMPFFNTPSQFLREAIESVLAQSYSAWELLIVDDGSAPENAEMAMQYARRYPERVRYLDHPGHNNRGLPASRQVALDEAKGSYVAFLDADDVWLPKKLEQQVYNLDSMPAAGMLYGPSLYWRSWDVSARKVSHDYLPSLGVQPNTLIEPPALVHLFLAGKAAVPCTCSVVIRREVIDRVGGFRDIHQFLFEDQMLYAKVCLEYPVFVSDSCWDKYRQHPDSGCSVAAQTDEIDASRLAYLQWLKDYLLRKETTEPAVTKELNRQLWLHSQPNWLRRSRRGRRWLRRTKKWLLRVEERLLPKPVRSMLWVRGALTEQRAPEGSLHGSWHGHDKTPEQGI